MKTFELEGKEYTLPEGWHEVNLGLFEKLVEHSLNLPEYKSNLQFALEMLSLLLGLDVSILKKLNKESFEVLSDSCSWTSEEITPSNKEVFEIDDKIFVPLKDYNSITMGEQIDLELIVADSKPHETLSNILPVLLREAKKVDKNGETILKPSEYNYENYSEYKELFRQNVMVADVIKFRDNFFFGEKQ